MDGHCIYTIEWRKEYAIKECNPELFPAPKVAAPAPAPAPAAEPSPAPAAAAAAAAAAVVAAEKDSDNDGVPDSKDKCPDTPAGVKVDANGCPIDSDNDGVPDYLDKCPDTPAGAKVDAEGCVVSITLKVQFDSGKSAVKSEYLPELEQFAQALKQKPDVKVEIQGHTDNVGSAAKNKSLSEARAKAVRDVLVKKYGIAADRVTAKGYGMEKPVAGNDTPEGREKNRRVEAVRVK
jgi:OOP family OmpA-OmpF porin